ncbi:MAG TPA: 8-amino-7-oxononanoate synthase, partial [Polyangia bacterium]|nr:8-amino-7-oxononanoate synthase [Polyangia bacterium]
MRGFAALLEAELDALAAADRRRVCPEASGASRVHPDVRGQRMLSFCSNDYLGLASHPVFAAAAAEAAARDGYGASASRLVSGDLPAHRALEATLAGFLDRPAALAFPSGYQTNVGVLTALAGREDLIVSDALNHASLVDGCRLSRARVEIYPHGDALAAQRLLAASGPYRRRILVTESLFSMDGDSAPLAALSEAAVATDSIFVVDEAHAFGVLGPGGRGLCAAAGVVPDVLIGTLGKAAGAAGGFVAGAGALRELLVNRARTFIFTTALPPPLAAAGTAGVNLIAGPEGDRRRALLAERRQALGEALAARGWVSGVPVGPILPVVLGSEARALAVAEGLRARGLFIPAIRPPTVPAGSSRLRVTLSSAHEPADLARLVTALG